MMSTLCASRLSLQQEIANVLNCIKEVCPITNASASAASVPGTVGSILVESSFKTPSQLSSTPFELNQYNQTLEQRQTLVLPVDKSPSVSALSYEPMQRQVVNAAPQRNSGVSTIDPVSTTTNIANDRSPTFYAADSPIPTLSRASNHYRQQPKGESNHQHQDSKVARLFQLTGEAGEAAAAAAISEHSTTPAISTASRQQVNSSTPFERLLPHQHEQICQQLKILPPPPSSKTPVIIDAPSPSQPPRSGKASAEIAAALSSAIGAAAANTTVTSDCNLSPSEQVIGQPILASAASALSQSQFGHSPVETMQSKTPSISTSSNQQQKHSCHSLTQQPRILAQRPPKSRLALSRIQQTPSDIREPTNMSSSVPSRPQRVLDCNSFSAKLRYKDAYEQYKVRQYDVYFVTIRGPIMNMRLEPCLNNNEFKVYIN